MARKKGLDARDWFAGQSFVSSARERIYERLYSYDLYNTATKQIEATDMFTLDDVQRRNDVLIENQEPQRWVPTPWVNH